MFSGCERRARILLKARPTPTQLHDRLAAPWPDGLEFYLDREDIVQDNWLINLVAEVGRHKLPDEFVYVVEGPLRSIDGSFFDLSQGSEANRETLRRTVEFGAAVGAEVAVVHAISPADNPDGFSDELRQATLQRSLPLLSFYRDLCRAQGMVPTIENIPPVAQMREGKFMHSIIGMEPADLLDLTAQVKDVKVTVDVSHAQLYLNAVNARRQEVPAEWHYLVTYIQQRAQISTIDEFIAALNGHLVEAHISNASGLYGEGLPYDQGDLPLDVVVARLSRVVRFLVTETIEPDADAAIRMREAQRRMAQALNREAQ